jgi:hypothetical protein
VAIDSGSNPWFLNSSSYIFAKVNAAGTSGTAEPTTGTVSQSPGETAIDGSGSAWASLSDYATGHTVDNAIVAASNMGTNLTGAHGYVPLVATVQPACLTIDGSGNIWWAAGSTDGSTVAAGTLYEIVGAAVPVATPIAYGVKNSMLGTRP